MGREEKSRTYLLARSVLSLQLFLTTSKESSGSLSASSEQQAELAGHYLIVVAAECAA